MKEYDEYRDIEAFEIGDFLVRMVAVGEIEEICRIATRTLGTEHRQLFHTDRYGNSRIATVNAHECLAGFCILDKGVYVFHDPPNRIFNSPLALPRGKSMGAVMGGGHDYWDSASEEYTRQMRGMTPMYISKPQGHEKSADYSFGFLIDMAERDIQCGYYYNPKGPGGDGWIWE